MPFFDGAAGKVYYRHWAQPQPRLAMLFSHGFGEHSGLYHRFAAELGAAGIDLWGLDLPGHGLSAGERGQPGTLDQLLRDRRRLYRLIRTQYPKLPVVAAGHSLGSVVALLSALEQPGDYRAAVISGAPLTPPDWLVEDQRAGETSLRLDLEMLSADPSYRDQIATDPLTFTAADAIGALRAVLGPAQERLASQLPGAELPILAVHGEQDMIIPVSGVASWAERVPGLDLRVISGANHDVLNDVDHRAVADQTAAFVSQAIRAQTSLVTDRERAAIADVLRFPLVQAINSRRSRRFPVGGRIPSGELAFTSSKPAQPLSELERALVLATVSGVTGWHFGITHHGGYAPALPNYSGSAVGRSFPSAAGFHTSDFFFTDDTGTYFLSTRDTAPDPSAAPMLDVDKWLSETTRSYQKLSDDRIYLPRAEPYLEGHNTWIANHPGSLLIIPVADLSQHFIANIAFFTQNGYGIYDDIHDRPIPGAGDPGLRHAGEPFPLSFVEQYTLAEASAELMTSVYAGHLVLGALGLGGWAFDGIDRLSMLGASGNPQVPGLGFAVQCDDRWSLPNPTGLPGVFETLSRPHVRDAEEAVDRFIERKFGVGGPFHVDTPGPPPSHARAGCWSIRSATSTRPLGNCRGRFPPCRS